MSRPPEDLFIAVQLSHGLCRGVLRRVGVKPKELQLPCPIRLDVHVGEACSAEALYMVSQLVVEPCVRDQLSLLVRDYRNTVVAGVQFPDHHSSSAVRMDLRVFDWPNLSFISWPFRLPA